MGTKALYMASSEVFLNLDVVYLPLAVRSVLLVYPFGSIFAYVLMISDTRSSRCKEDIVSRSKAIGPT